MLNFFAKFIFLWKRPKVVVVCGNGRALASEAIFCLLKSKFPVEKLKEKISFLSILKSQILILEIDLFDSKQIEKIIPLLKKSSLPVLVVTPFTEIPAEVEFFAGPKEATIEAANLAKNLPSFSRLILNFDDEAVRDIADLTNLHTLTFGFQKRADIFASDINLNSGTNFKINYSGNIVPVWLDKIFGKEQIFTALAAAAVGIVFGLNLVEISHGLKDYQGLPGKMKLIEGVKQTWILDDSENASVQSMIEALLTLGRIDTERLQRGPQGPRVGGLRKIAVLGDILGIGKYTIEAHEAIGEIAFKNCDLLFTFGPRAKFISQGAIQKGMAIEKIFQFDKIEEGKLKLKEEIKKGDLILVDGSSEMQMSKIVEEIKQSR